MKKVVELSAADAYRAGKSGREEKLVDVRLPGGDVFQFAELPGVFVNAFTLSKLPQVAASGAVQKWIEDGIIQPGDIAEDQAAAVNEGIRLVDLILDHSRVPKLVAGPALNPGELSAGELSNEDAKFLFDWAKAGGDVGLMLTTFPSGSQQRPVGVPNRKERRAKAKRAS